MKIIKNLNWDMWGTAAFFSFCLSTVFMIFFSTDAVQNWAAPWNRLSILFACFIPLLLVIVWKIPEWIKAVDIKNELRFIPVIVLLGVLNIVFSEARDATLTSMVLFLISGIMIFGVTKYLLISKGRQMILLWIYVFILFILSTYGLYEYFNKVSIRIFTSNPLPAGALLILLFVGPFTLILYNTGWLRFIQIFTIVFGAVIIVLIGKRGPVLGLIVMAFSFILLPGRKKWIIPIVALIILSTGYKFRNFLPPKYYRISYITTGSTTHRLDNLNLAYRIFLRKPIFGIGLHAPFGKYLKNYKPVFAKNPGSYLNYANRDKTFENTWICMLVAMGSLFFITYIFLFIYLLKNLFQRIKDNPKKNLQALLFLIPIFAFIINSMTNDTLVYPHINWIFHSLLGIMANFSES